MINYLDYNDHKAGGDFSTYPFLLFELDAQNELVIPSIVKCQ